MHDFSYHIFPNQSFVDLGLYQFGKEICESGHSFGPAKRNHYLFHYVLSGRGSLAAENESGVTRNFTIRSGEGFMIFPDQVTTYIADHTDPWEYAWLEFDGLRVKQALLSAGFSQSRPVYRPKYENLRDLMCREILYINDHSDESTLHLIGHLFLFLDFLARSSSDTRGPVVSSHRDFYIRETISYIENHYQESISVESIAETIGLNRSYFGKIFRTIVGKSPQQFLMNYRMIKAAELISGTQMTIREIGSAVGYPNQMHFSRAFKTIYGVSPLEWRKQNKG